MGTTAYWQANDQVDNLKQQAKTKPLDTSSKKIAGEYKGGKVTEGELNAYINLNSFFDPQLAALFSASDADAVAQQKQARQEFAKVYLTKKYIASLQKVTPEEQKKIDQQGKELEKQVIQYSQMMNQNAKITNIQEAIQGKGFTQKQLVEVAEQDSKVDMYLGKQIENSTYDRVKLRHILVSFTQAGAQAQEGQPNRTEEEAKKRALEVKKKLEDGGDFNKLAKEYSDDPGSKDKGGLYDSDVSGFVPEFANAAKTLPIGKISEPIKTDYGFHVMKVEERTQMKVKDAPKDQLEQIQSTKKQEAFSKIEKEIGVKLYI
jgi:foldase protein PrsA